MSDIGNRFHNIASAIYLITGFFGDQEPLKWRLRSFSADLVSDKIKDKLNTTKEISALFGIAKSAGLISDSNYDIFAQEFSKLERELESPLKLMFIEESSSPEKALPKPAEVENIKDNSEEKEAPNPALKGFGAVSLKKNSRQSIIINLLKRKKEIMIKDVVPLIDGCSEKTVQRELLSMVAQGILKKMGEKRWSRYVLA